MGKRSREIFHDGKGRKKPERHMDNILKMFIPVKNSSEVSRPGSAALGNTDAMRASLRNSRRSFSGHVRLVLRLGMGLSLRQLSPDLRIETGFVFKLPEKYKQI